MRKKTIVQKPPREKIHKLPAKSRPSTRSRDQTFTPSPSPPTSPPRTNPMGCTKNPSRFPPSAKQTPPPKEPPSKPGSSQPSSSKGKRPAATEPTFEPTQPKTRSEKDKPLPYGIFLTCIFEHFGVDLSNEDYDNRHSYLKGGGSVKQQKGPTRSERVVLDDEDDDFIPKESPPPSTEGTSISTGQKSALLNVVRDVVQEFVSQSNLMIAMNEDPATDAEEEADSEGNGSDA
ncbi:swi5-dependent recombination DNA repair protein 1 homolog [Arachis ipaensis]|uniref:swi5-dependent recombination DNA repair protein 1 homolog n=1 Tax=Arachis ipaensis TaxID=130454 RepID=UPI0007AF542A|nr:swi5-dependent recombination DNA repair protein 1 homolog [Arachis ipaensis]